MEQRFFQQVADDKLRRTLAETLYGARWIYKLGLALLVQGNEQMAHVRCQVIDYGSCCEGLLYDAIRHALHKRITVGKKHQFEDTKNLKRPIMWVRGIDATAAKQSFHWHIEVAQEETIVDAALAQRLHTLRKARNTVHVKARTYQAFLGVSREAYQTLLYTTDQTRTWRHRHP
jgi:hypothetical protein